jgi:mRNA interferase MazF
MPEVTVLPITSSNPDSRLLPVVVLVAPSIENGLTTNSYVVCIDPMTFDKQRLIRQLEILESVKIQQIQSILCAYLELDSLVGQRVKDCN